MDPRNELPAPQEHLLLPKAHVHYFAQVVVLVLSILFIIGGGTLLTLGYLEQSQTLPANISALDKAYELLFFLGAGIVLGLGVATLLLWILWKFVERFRVRFLVSLAVSTVGIVAGLLFVALSNPESGSHYAFYFFSLTTGLLSGLLSLFYFFSGFSRHLFGTHKQKESFTS